MAKLKEYECPACGGMMEFNVATQKLRCPYCATELAADALEDEEENQDEQADGSAGAAEDSFAAQSGNYTQEELEHLKVYSCKSCGAEIVAEENTVSSKCPYCGNNVVMTGQFAGGKKPDGVIPFKITKEEAQNIYKEHIKTRWLAPKIFKDNRKIDEIKGVYVPFYLVSGTAYSHVSGMGYSIGRRWSDKEYDYTETKEYEIDRDMNLPVADIPSLCTDKANSILMESIEPFDTKGLKPYAGGFLAGFAAESYKEDYVPKCLAKAKERMATSVYDALTSSITEYSSNNITNHTEKIGNLTYKYCLLPVWFFTERYNDKAWNVVINGQTGKVAGVLPEDKKKFTLSVLIKAVVIAAVAYAVKLFLKF